MENQVLTAKQESDREGRFFVYKECAVKSDIWGAGISSPLEGTGMALNARLEERHEIGDRLPITEGTETV